MTFAASDRVNRIQPSATLAISARANAMKAQGVQVISLSVGEPDFETPQNIKQAAIKAIEAGFTRYTAVDGIPALKQAIREKLKRDNQLDYANHEIIASTGAKQCIYNLLQILLNPKDEVIIPAPYWVSYPDMVLLADATPVFIATESQAHFKITASQLAQTINENTRALILNSPSNPTGMIYSYRELQALGEVLKKYPKVWVISDDIYEHIRWGEEKFCNIINACPELKNRTIVINGVSKAYAMTGWRLGYAAGPEAAIQAMEKIQGQSTSNPCSITQKAAVEALSGPQDSLRVMVNAFKKRHDLACGLLNQIKTLKVQPGQGAFYLFIDAKAALKQLDLPDDLALCDLLLNTAHVAAVPGSAFGSPGHFRISYALSEADIKTAISRIARALT